MKNFREKNHITVTDAGYIYLTESGKVIADTTSMNDIRYLHPAWRN